MYKTCYFKDMSKRTLRQKVYSYTAVFEPAEEGGYTVYIPTLPGCVSEGDSFEEAMTNIKEAASLYLETWSKRKISIPKETDSVFVAPIRVEV